MAVAMRQPDDYAAFCERIAKLTSIELAYYRREQMERRIRSFAARRDIHSLYEYADLLARSPEELERFLDRMTINVSQLWRNPEQWTLLASSIIPELAQSGQIRVWSAGCSYGAEAYSLAVVCLEHAKNARVRIVGTDIDSRVLERARAGRLSAEDARTMPQDSLRRWFRRDGDGWTPGPELRALVDFRRGDLLVDPPPAATFDLVLCRNVVIYFTDPVRDELHARLAQTLRPGGYLVIGSTERVYEPRALGLVPKQPFVYLKG